VFSKHGGKLVGERTRKPLSFEIIELLFGDNGVIVCCTRQDMEEATRVFVTGSAKTEHNSAIQIFQYKALKYIG